MCLSGFAQLCMASLISYVPRPILAKSINKTASSFFLCVNKHSSYHIQLSKRLDNITFISLYNDDQNIFDKIGFRYLRDI